MKPSFGVCSCVLGDAFAIVNKTTAVTGIETPITSHTCHLNGFRKTYICMFKTDLLTRINFK